MEFSPSSWSERVSVWQRGIRNGTPGAVPIFAEVEAPGTYRFSLRRWPEEMDEPIRAAAEQKRIRAEQKRIRAAQKRHAEKIAQKWEQDKKSNLIILLVSVVVIIAIFGAAILVALWVR